MNKYRVWTIVLIIIMVSAGWFIYVTQRPHSRLPFKLGLDLAGGTQVIYSIDSSQVDPSDVPGQLESLKDLIERRINDRLNAWGGTESTVQIEGANTFSSSNKLIVDLPGVTNIEEAVKVIGETPLLEFKILDINNASTTALLNATSTDAATLEKLYTQTELNGRYLTRASLVFNNQIGGEPSVSLNFNAEGTEIFATLTRENVGKILAIFLDGVPISQPVIREEISNGEAQISGNFTPTEAKELVDNLKNGALPMPITLASTQTIGPSLGSSAVDAGVQAGIVGFIVVVAFLILWYRLPGAIASVALIMYVIISLVLFKLIPVTLTAAGLAGFILSIGMAVDANILIFERMKEELRNGKKLTEAIHEGFHRAWLSIRDSNISSIITAIVLFWLGTSAVKGFALTLGLGVLISMFTAITVSRTFLFALPQKGEHKASKFLFGAGFHSSNSQ